MERIPLIEELRSEAVRLAAAAGGEANNSQIWELLNRTERALRFLLAVTGFAEGKVVYPQRLHQRLKELGLK
jgi:hypothetical protein